MTRQAMPLAAILLAGCGDTSGTAEGSKWLAGSWLPLGSGTPYPLACESDAVVIYEADGQFHDEGGSGTWTLAGDELTETVRTVRDFEPDTPVTADPERSRVERLEADRFRKHHAGGEAVVYSRCPSA